MIQPFSKLTTTYKFRRDGPMTSSSSECGLLSIHVSTAIYTCENWMHKWIYAELSIHPSTVIYTRKLNSQLSTSNMLYCQKSRNRTASFVYGGHSATQLSPESQMRFWLDRLHDVQYSTTTRTTTLTTIFLLECYSITITYRISTRYCITWPNTTIVYLINDIKPSARDAGPESRQFVMPRYAYRAEV